MSKILVTDGGYSHALCIIRSLTSLGHIVDCIGHPLCLSSFSFYLNKCAFKQSKFKAKYISEFLSFLEKEKYDFLSSGPENLGKILFDIPLDNFTFRYIFSLALT